VVGALRDLRRLVVADVRASAVTSHQRAGNVIGDPLLVGLQALDAMLAERAAPIGKELDPVSRSWAMIGLKTLSSKLPWLPRSDRDIVGHHLDGDHP